jgi:hypothetical protein
MTRQAVGEISMPIPRANFQGDTDDSTFLRGAKAFNSLVYL